MLSFQNTINAYLQFGRWSLLTAGILYGAYHHNRLSKKEVINRKIEAEKKVVRDAQLAIEKKKRYEGINHGYSLSSN